MKDKELTHAFNQIRHELGDMWKSKIRYNMLYLTINLTKVSKTYLGRSRDVSRTYERRIENPVKHP